MRGTRTDAFIAVDGNKIGEGVRLVTNGPAKIWQTRFSYPDFSIAATTKNLDITFRPGLLMIVGVWWWNLANWTGGTISALTVSVGTTSDAVAYMAATSVFASSAPKLIAGKAVVPGTFFMADPSSATFGVLRVQMLSTDGNISALTAGRGDLFVKLQAVNLRSR